MPPGPSSTFGPSTTTRLPEKRNSARCDQMRDCYRSLVALVTGHRGHTHRQSQGTLRTIHLAAIPRSTSRVAWASTTLLAACATSSGSRARLRRVLSHPTDAWTISVYLVSRATTSRERHRHDDGRHPSWLAATVTASPLPSVPGCSIRSPRRPVAVDDVLKGGFGTSSVSVNGDCDDPSTPRVPGRRRHAHQLPPRHHPHHPRGGDDAFAGDRRRSSAVRPRGTPGTVHAAATLAVPSHIRCRQELLTARLRGHPPDHPRGCDDPSPRASHADDDVLTVAFGIAFGSSARVYRPRSPASPRRSRFDPRGNLREHQEAQNPESKTEGKIKAWCQVGDK